MRCFSFCFLGYKKLQLKKSLIKRYEFLVFKLRFEIFSQYNTNWKILLKQIRNDFASKIKIILLYPQNMRV